MEDYVKKLTGGLQSLRENDAFVDFTIEVDDSEFHVHKVILASMSDYFKTMLMSGMTETQMDRVKLKAFSYSTVASLVKYIYTGEIDIQHSTAEELLHCAVYLQIEPAVIKCTKMMTGEVNQQNCFKTLNTLRTYSLTDGLAEVQNFVRKHVNLNHLSYKLEDMPYQEFVCFMEFWEKSAWKLFDKVNLWLSADFENRMKHLNDVMGCIPFGLMTPKQLQSLKGTFTYQNFEGAWRDVVEKAIEYNKLPMHLKVTEKSDLNKIKGPVIPMCFNANDPKEFYVLQRPTFWDALRGKGAPKLEAGVAARVVVNNFLILCETTCPDQKCHIFDPRTLQWSDMAKLNFPRDLFALAQHDGYLYALGGMQLESDSKKTKTDGVEKYDFKTNTWTMHPTPLLVKLSNHCACTVDDFIYVAGGWGEYGFFDRVDVYDIRNDTWSISSQGRPYPVPDHLVPVQVGKEKLILTVTGGSRHFYNPSTYEWSDLGCGWYTVDGTNDDDDVEEFSDDGVEFVGSGKGMTLSTENMVYFINYPYRKAEKPDSDCEMDEWAETEYQHFSGGCMRWTFSDQNKMEACKLDDMPFMDKMESFSVLLAIPPYLLK